MKLTEDSNELNLTLFLLYTHKTYTWEYEDVLNIITKVFKI
jgi:hypothetical protein